MSTPSLASKQVQAVQARMLHHEWRDAATVTLITLVFLFVVPPLVYWFHNEWKQVLTMVAALICVIAAAWARYFLTRYRMRKGYFGTDAIEATETLAFLDRERRNKK